MKLTYDERAGAAYLRLRGGVEDVGTLSSRSSNLRAPSTWIDRITLGFDEDGRLVGIELLTPDDRLLPSVLAAAERRGRNRS